MYKLSHQLLVHGYQLLLVTSLIFVAMILPAYGQTVNCQYGCMVTVTPNPSPSTQATSNSLSSSAPTIGGINLGDIASQVLQAIQNLITTLEGQSIPQNNYVNTTGIQKATGSGFNVINDLFKAGFDTSQFVTDLIDSFQLFHISFWIVALISIGITIFLIVKTGENIIKKIAVLLVIVTIILAVLWLIATLLHL